MTPQAEVTSPMLTDSDRPKKNIIIGQSSGEEEKFGAKLASPAAAAVASNVVDSIQGK